jgi:hypothetical protein
VILVAGAERSGKSLWTAREILARLPWCSGVAIAAQEYDESRAEMGYIVKGLQILGGLERKSTPQQGKWMVQARGGIEIETVSLNDGPEELTRTGKPFDVVALVEAGGIRYDAFLAARGRVAEGRGTVLLSGTLRDNVGWYANLWTSFEGPNVFEGERFSFPAWSNKAVYPGGRRDPEILRLERILPGDEFARRVAALVVPSPARIYPEFDFGLHVAEVTFDPRLPVELAVDPGYYPSRYAVLALQWRVEDGIEIVHQIDEVWEHHLMHHDVIDLCRQREWWGSVTRAVGGHETRQHQAAESTQEVWESLTDFRFEVFDAGRILDGVTRVKTFLKDPATKRARYVCDVGCTGTQEEFGKYRRKLDTKGNVISEEPEDKNNDAMDALRNWLVERYGLVERESRSPRPGKRRLPDRG